MEQDEQARAGAQGAAPGPEVGGERGQVPEAPEAAREHPAAGHAAPEQFGGRVARQMDALIEEERSPAHVDPKTAPRPERVDWREKLAGMDFDARVDATIATLKRRTTFRDILYGLLGFCMEERPYEEIEPYVQGFVEFHRNRQSPRRYVQMLLRTGALEEIELDEQGEVLTEEAKRQAVADGLDPEDLDTLVFDWRVVTTDAGRAAYERFSPGSRIAELIGADPAREEALVRIMEFCCEPRSMGQVVDEFSGSELLGIDEESRLPRQPSAYIEKLDRAGAVQWDGERWKLTEQGEDYLLRRPA